jgi:outer membrane protein OmpA-like peptidoglycan-associated protein
VATRLHAPESSSRDLRSHRTRRSPRARRLAASASLKARRRAASAGLALLMAAASAGGARAQQLNLAAFAPSAQPALTFIIPQPLPAPHGSLQLALAFDYARDPLRVTSLCGPSSPGDRACAGDLTSADARVAQLGSTTLLVDLALFDALSLSLSAPMAIADAALDGGLSSTRAGLGDLGVAVSGGWAAQRGTAVGWSVGASLPTAREGTFAGEHGVTLTPSLSISQTLGRLSIAGRVGYHLRRRQVVFGIEQDDELLVGVGARYALQPALAIVADYWALLGIGGRRFTRAEAPAEIDLGVRLGSTRDLQLDLGIGTRAWPGDQGAGAPAFRGFFVLRHAFDTAVCSSGPEDYDGWQDADGCADLDNDLDGIPDSADACPNDAEDHDGFADEDGCPDLDNDADGIPDSQDLCPDHSEDRDGFQDLDGCPEPDNDADGVADGRDRCPLDPEDRDGFDDEDGCPEPGPGRPTVTLSGSRLLMSDRVYFDDQADTLHPMSGPALDALAATMKSLTGHPRVRVEGHTDDSGNPQANIDLSYRRARAVVEYLKAAGVPAEQLEYVGRGSSEPLAPNSSPEGRALNRRVEFVVIRP